jgi:hypothetical protein
MVMYLLSEKKHMFGQGVGKTWNPKLGVLKCTLQHIDFAMAALHENAGKFYSYHLPSLSQVFWDNSFFSFSFACQSFFFVRYLKLY